MNMTFRHYGDSDPVTLETIRQIPLMSGVVTALYSVPVGQPWDEASIVAMRDKVHAAGLAMEVIESVPVHEEIKLGSPAREALIDNYCQTIRRLGKVGVKVVCYNFMPVFDWVRSNLKYVTADGSNCLAYDAEVIDGIDPEKDSLSLPGWDESYTREEMRGLLDHYRTVDRDRLFENLIYFLAKIMPVCEECDVKMAIHPDDPPWGLFGLPRIISGEADLDRLFSAVPSLYNGVTFCTGSLGANRDHDLVKMAAKYAAMGRIHFAHIRNICFEEGKGRPLFFHESPHPTACGSLDIYAVLRALHENGFDGYIRPDHGRNIWGEDGRPGYGLYDRALGACYINGVWEALEKSATQRR